MRTIQHWIAGSETTGTSARFGPVYDPATGRQQAQVALAERADVDAAVAAAAKAFEEWSETSLTRRARVMFAMRDLVERHPVVVVLRARTLDEAIEIINGNPYGNGAAIFTSSGPAPKKFERRVQAGMVGVNVRIPVPMAFYSFGGWKDSLFGDTHVHGPEGVRFYTRAKAVTSRWPDPDYATHHSAHLHFPTAT